jgi:hypothetical protein
LQREAWMGAAAHKKKVKLFHASMLVTASRSGASRQSRLRKRARALLASGNGHRCHLGDCLHVEVEHFEDQR